MSDITRLTQSLADRYAIEREIGAGGMATVYLARDLKHERQVAVKVLKPELGAVLGVERFLAEIKTTANLQHPNLLPLFDSGEADGLLFYVMPFVEGESLRARLDREKQLPVDEAVRIAVAVANALDYAHGHKVIHRDLKPENILLQHGQPVIADFGIALAVSNAGGARITQTGLSLGTPQYMSPEQATGDRVVDGRSDTYSLAAMTYEMLVGDPPHLGSTAQAVIAKVLTERPPNVRLARAAVPEHVAAAIEVALEKLAADRFATAREFAEALQGRGQTLASRGATSPHGSVAEARGETRALVRHPIVLALAGLAATAITVAAVQWTAAHREVPAITVRFPLTLPPSLNSVGVSRGSDVIVSPDGKTIAFAANGAGGLTRLYVRSLDDVNPRVVPGTENASQIFFSPDGRSLGFFANGKVYKVAIEGGSPLPIAEVPSPLGITWSPSGTIVASSDRGLVAFPAVGGTPSVLTRPDSTNGEVYHQWPVALPDGEHVLFANLRDAGNGNGTIGVVSLKTRKVTIIDVGAIFPLGVADGYLVFVNNARALLVMPFDAATLRPTGAPTPMATDVVVGGTGAAKAAISPTGTLVFRSGSQVAQAVLVDGRGSVKPFLPDARPYAYPRFSPDGTRIAFTIMSGVRSDIWIHDMASGTSTRLTTEGTTNERPEWSPDGKRVLYRSDRGKRSAIWWQPADLSGPATTLIASDRDDFFEGVLTPDGLALVYQQDNLAANGADVLYRLLAGDSTPKPIAASQFIEDEARVSPDGKWVAYQTTASGANEVVVQPFPGPGARLQVSTGGGNEPVWSRDGKRLFYRDGQRFIAATYTTTPSFTITSRATLFDGAFAVAGSPHANYDVTPDGSHFLMLKGTESTQLVVVYNWIAEMRSRLAARK